MIFNIDKGVDISIFNVLQEGIKIQLSRAVEAYEKESIISKIYDVRSMSGFQEEVRSTSNLGDFKPTEDMQVVGLDTFEDTYFKQFRTQIWTSGYAISKQLIEDKQEGSIEPKSMGLIAGFGRTREKYAVAGLGAALGKANADLKLSALSGTGADTVDGSIEGVKQQYFHNAHLGALIKGSSLTTQSNKFYCTLDFTGADKEIESKVLDVIGQVENYMNKFKNDNGEPVPVNPTRIVMGQDYRLKNVLERGLKSKYGEAMGGNGVNLKYGKYEVVYSPYLSAVDGFEDSDHALILIDPVYNKIQLGAVWFDRTPLEIDSYIDNETKANVISARARWGLGFNDFRAMAYINLAGTETSNSTAITPLVSGVTPISIVSVADGVVFPTEEVSV